MRLQYADWGFANPLNKIRGNPNMGAIFTSPGRTVIAGIVLLIIIVVAVGLVTGQMTHIDHAWATFAMRWLHVISGILWIGLLWYLNFVQVPTMPTIQPVERRTAITKFIAPNVLFYFRYAALATVITGLFRLRPTRENTLGLVEATAEQNAAAAKPAHYASRFNTMFSIGMLYCM